MNRSFYVANHGINPMKKGISPKFLALLLAVLVPMLNVVSAAPAAGPAAESLAQHVVQHKIQARIDPDDGTIAATDELVLPDGTGQVQLHLHAGLSPEVIGGEAVLERIGRAGHLERFRLTPRGSSPIRLRYAGRIRHDLQAVREGMGRARQQTIGTIDADGVFLSGYTGWYPSLPGTLVSFTLDVELPPGWLAVSQGAGPVIEDQGQSTLVRWQERQPQDEIHLAAAPFKLYRQPTPVAEAQAYLRLPDDALAQRYLDVTADYLIRYSRLIGDYPYDKFALVENFWETGYGMPSFTLLGSQVLRLPFILHSSYPHEILHNWWGNGVYVDYASGNWSEGLTAYLADHLNQELEGRGDDYRRDQLKAYADYVRDASDFPLTEFRGRHGSASQAVGYGKTLMLFHMLRVQLGDEAFIRGLQRFYRDNLFRTASWDDVETAFELAADADLGAFFKAWTTRPGAPALDLTDVRTEPSPDGGWTVRGRIVQGQQDAPFPMTVPLVIHAERGEPQELRLELAADLIREGLDFSRILAKPKVGPEVATYNSEPQDHGLERALDHRLIEQAQPALEHGEPVRIETSVKNYNRTVGTMLSGRVAERYGHKGLPDDTIYIKARGIGGQSFGAWLAHGVTIELEGEANDYVGKGLSGGRLIIYPPADSGIEQAEDNIIVGNTVLYGAISGEVYFRGVAGERFCVRNSGASAVVEGVGDHGCEYMTGGVMVCLGPTGRNFAAGMSGGIAYVLNESNGFEDRCNLAMVELEPIAAEDAALEALDHQGGDLEAHGLVDVSHDMTRYDAIRLKQLIQRHLHYTNSDVARRILDDWDNMLGKFVKVMPVDYRNALMQMQTHRSRPPSPPRPHPSKLRVEVADHG